MNVASRTEGRRRALITGIAGFTGRYLAAELDAAGYEVFGTVQAQDVGGAGHLACDLLDADGVRAVVAEVQPDVVAHLAAVSFVTHEQGIAIKMLAIPTFLLAAVATTDQLAQLQGELKCGTNCGSCLPKLRSMVRKQLEPA